MLVGGEIRSVEGGGRGGLFGSGNYTESNICIFITAQRLLYHCGGVPRGFHNMP